LEISFNNRFLIDGIQNIKGSEVILELTEPDKAAVLKPKNLNNYLYVLMPITPT